MSLRRLEEERNTPLGAAILTLDGTSRDDVASFGRPTMSVTVLQLKLKWFYYHPWTSYCYRRFLLELEFPEGVPISAPLLV